MLLALLCTLPFTTRAADTVDAAAIAKASDLKTTTAADGTVHIGWPRTVPVTVDDERLPPAAGLGVWAAFKAAPNGKTIAMSDTALLRDEVDAAMDAALARGLKITALHNHFFYDEPKVYFMHTAGEGDAQTLASAYKAMWDAVKAIRARHPHPATGFGGAPIKTGKLDAHRIAEMTGLKPEVKSGVVKVSSARSGHYDDTDIGGPMGLSSWAAFVGSDARASVDGDFIMIAAEVQPIIKALRAHDVHVVALHNHMIGEHPDFYFLHFWGKGPADTLARAFKAALDAQAGAGGSH
jgi:hypothetical protein